VRGTSTTREMILEHFKRSADLKLRTAEACAQDIEHAADLIANTFRSGGKLLICGNGGSAADAQHLAAEFVSVLTREFERPGLPAIALTTDTSLLTAYANDFDFDGVFARQVQALGSKRDALVAISTSGTSRNVLRAAAEARAIGMPVVALTGAGGALAEMSDVCIPVPATVTMHIQECHLAIEHVICGLVERKMFGIRAAAADQFTVPEIDSVPRR
jgi:phosphoheptose isomerase